ncbi:MAG: hypothetical protein AB8H79_01460 [Myxococcota bacterium]
MNTTTRTALMTGSLILAGLAGSSAAQAAGKGRPVTVRVVDVDGQALPNAVVRVPKTEGKTRVNRNGEWTESMLYTTDGDEFTFAKNEWLVFNISAPGFHARPVKYKVRGRKNYVEIALRPMPEPTAPLAESADQDLLIRWFQRTEIEEGPSAVAPSDPPN